MRLFGCIGMSVARSLGSWISVRLRKLFDYSFFAIWSPQICWTLLYSDIWIMFFMQRNCHLTVWRCSSTINWTSIGWCNQFTARCRLTHLALHHLARLAVAPLAAPGIRLAFTNLKTKDLQHWAFLSACIWAKKITREWWKQMCMQTWGLPQQPEWTLEEAHIQVTVVILIHFKDKGPLPNCGFGSLSFVMGVFFGSFCSRSRTPGPKSEFPGPCRPWSTTQDLELIKTISVWTGIDSKRSDWLAWSSLQQLLRCLTLCYFF